MNLQPLYDVKERLEYAAIAGTGLLGEDFRLQRAAESMQPLAQASPVFAKINDSLQKLLSAPAEQRAGLLMDTLSLVDAVAYTQARTGAAGELEPLAYEGCGTYQQVSRGQLQPLLTALTTTGGGRMEIIQSSWDAHPEYFSDYRVLPALIAGLGDSYSEIADLNADILKKLGAEILPLLKKDFDPAGKREMSRRVEVISAIESTNATPWLLKILPDAKKDVRASVITALGMDAENTDLLLDLAKSERGKNREAVLNGLARQKGKPVEDFWEAELKKNGGASAFFLGRTKEDWASELVAFRLQKRLEEITGKGESLEKNEQEELYLWRAAALGKSSPAMLDFWRWVDRELPAIDSIKRAPGPNSQKLSEQLEEWLLDSVCTAGASPLCDVCRELWEKDKERPRYLPHAFLSALLTRSPAEVYEEFSPYICTEIPETCEKQKKALHTALFRAFARLSRSVTNRKPCLDGGALDIRWISRLTSAVWTQEIGRLYNRGHVAAGFDVLLTGLANPDDPEVCAIMVPYLRRRMAEVGSYYSYGHWLLDFHGSFVGVLEKSLHNCQQTVYAYHVWQLFNDAAQTLPPQELAAGLQEVRNSKALRKEDNVLMEKAIPAVIQLLEAGRPFPEWSEIWKMR